VVAHRKEADIDSKNGVDDRKKVCRDRTRAVAIR
jgi:hypothetical protein